MRRHAIVALPGLLTLRVSSDSRFNDAISETIKTLLDDCAEHLSVSQCSKSFAELDSTQARLAFIYALSAKGNKQTRSWAYNQIAQSGREGIENLLKMIDDDTPELNTQILKAIHTTPDAISILKNIADSSSSIEIRLGVLEYLKVYGKKVPRQTVKIFINLLDFGEEVVREVVTRMIDNSWTPIISRLEKTLRDDLGRALVEMVNNSNRQDEAFCAAAALEKFNGNAKYALIPLLKFLDKLGDDGLWARGKAMQDIYGAVGDYADPKDIDKLLSLYKLTENDDIFEVAEKYISSAIEMFADIKPQRENQEEVCSALKVLSKLCTIDDEYDIRPRAIATIEKLSIQIATKLSIFGNNASVKREIENAILSTTTVVFNSNRSINRTFLEPILYCLPNIAKHCTEEKINGEKIQDTLLRNRKKLSEQEADLLYELLKGRPEQGQVVRDTYDRILSKPQVLTKEEIILAVRLSGGVANQGIYLLRQIIVNLKKGAIAGNERLHSAVCTSLAKLSWEEPLALDLLARLPNDDNWGADKKSVLPIIENKEKLGLTEIERKKLTDCAKPLAAVLTDISLPESDYKFASDRLKWAFSLMNEEQQQQVLVKALENANSNKIIHAKLKGDPFKRLMVFVQSLDSATLNNLVHVIVNGLQNKHQRIPSKCAQLLEHLDLGSRHVRDEQADFRIPQDVVQELLKQLKNDSENLPRIGTIRTLGLMCREENTDALGALFNCFNDNNPDVILAAARAIKNIRERPFQAVSDDLSERLARYLVDEDLTSKERQSIYRAAVVIGPSLIPTMVSEVNEDNADVYLKTISEIIEQNREGDGRSLLIRCVRSSYDELRICEYSKNEKVKNFVKRILEQFSEHELKDEEE